MSRYNVLMESNYHGFSFKCSPFWHFNKIFADLLGRKICVLLDGGLYVTIVCFIKLVFVYRVR